MYDVFVEGMFLPVGLVICVGRGSNPWVEFHRMGFRAVGFLVFHSLFAPPIGGMIIAAAALLVE